MEHLNALELNLSHERSRLAAAKTDAEREMRQVWVKQLEKEVAQEKAFLGIDDSCDLSDEELLAALCQ